jgi:hypothetical protein
MNTLLWLMLFQVKLDLTRNVSCTLTNHPYTLAHKQGDKLVNEDKDDWWVHCKVTVGNKVKLEQDLPLAHPTELQTAIDAVNEFRKAH